MLAALKMSPMSEFTEYLREAFVDFGPIETRRMFGGHGVFRNGVMFALVADDTLYLKADAAAAPKFTERGLKPFQYSKKGRMVTMSYYQAPEDILDDPERALVWGRLAFDAALRSKGK